MGLIWLWIGQALLFPQSSRFLGNVLLVGLMVFLLFLYNIDQRPPRLIALIFTWNMSNLKSLQGHWWWIRGWMWMLGTWKDCLWWIFSAIKLNRSKLWLWRNTSGLLSPDAVYMPLVGCDATWVWFDFESGQHCCFHIPAVLSFLPTRRMTVLDFSLCILAFVQWDCSYSLDSLECEMWEVEGTMKATC